MLASTFVPWLFAQMAMAVSTVVELHARKRLLALSMVYMAMPSMGRVPDVMRGRHSAVSVNSSHTSTNSQGSLCAKKGFPVCGVQYVPHLVGSPESAVDGNILDVYQSAYRWLHRRDLPLISKLGADTIRLQPWNVDVYGPNPSHSVQGRSEFFQSVKNSEVRKVIPTFRLSRHYADSLKNGGVDWDKDSSIAVQFKRFTRSVAEISRPLQLTAWSVDLSLDLHDLTDLTSKQGPACDAHDEPTTANYIRYKGLLQGLLNWVHGTGYENLKDVPLLLPLDISRLFYQSQGTATMEQLKWFLDCMSVWAGSGEGSTWTQPLFNHGSDFSNRWLWSFSVPIVDDPDEIENRVKADFIDNLQTLVGNKTNTNQAAAVIMLGTAAVRKDPNDTNVNIEDFGTHDNRSSQWHILKESVKQYTKLQDQMNKGKGVALDGFIVDEWQDNWDRGRQGPFVLAADSPDTMLIACDGSRFTHSTDQCGVELHNSKLFPQFLGLAGSTSRSGQHCVTPRFRSQLFRSQLFLQDGQADESEILPVYCAFMQPAIPWVVVCFLLVIGVVIGHCFQTRGQGNNANQGAQQRPGQPTLHIEEQVVVDVIKPSMARLRGDDQDDDRCHRIELVSSRFRSRTTLEMWLNRHLAIQCGILEHQVRTAMRDLEAVTMRQARPAPAPAPPPAPARQGPPEDDPERGPATPMINLDDDRLLQAAMEIVHKRCLQGFDVWCQHAHADLALPAGAERAVLFAEALVLRIMESLGEHIINCPERLSYLFSKILADTGRDTGRDNEPKKYRIDLEALHDGLEQMQTNANPFKWAKVPTRDGEQWQLGLNFDDINESGVQKREHVTKTFKEPHSIFVFIDLILCYRSVIFVKLWTFALAFYLYLGSRLGRDVTTDNNGGFFTPQWKRIDLIQYAGLLDACLWFMTEVGQLIYFTWQRCPSLGYKSPGAIDACWFLEHFIGLLISLVGFMFIYQQGDFISKDPACNDIHQCEDPRFTDGLMTSIGGTLLYWAVRLPMFIAMNRRKRPIFLFGDLRNQSTSWQFSMQDFKVLLCWLCMLATCVLFELYLLLPVTKGLDWERQCGLGFLSHTTRLGSLPQENGPCTEFWLTSSCMPCAMSIVFVWTLVLISVFLDIYFVMYVFCGIVGAIMGGHSRKINNIKSVAQTIDLRPGGTEAIDLETTMGQEWQTIFGNIVLNLKKESLLSPGTAANLAATAGVAFDGENINVTPDARRGAFELAELGNSLAAERLAFFFKSLSWIKEPHVQGENGPTFVPEFDAITGGNFHHGSITSLTQIIPAYNEVVIPSSQFLRDGNKPGHARNQNNEDVGERTMPPLGDGLNSNLAFIISQFPDEWLFLAEDLAARWRFLTGLPHEMARELYSAFMDPDRLNVLQGHHQAQRAADADAGTGGTGGRALTLEEEVRLWAAMRTQSVAKTVLGALQYHIALATLPGIRKYYERERHSRPDLRCPEDHVELLLAHQTYGQKKAGNSENNEAVELLLKSYQDYPFYLVFDCTPDSNDSVKSKVRSFLQVKVDPWLNGRAVTFQEMCAGLFDRQLNRGELLDHWESLQPAPDQPEGYEYCSCKCRWGKTELEIVEVLPRKYPLRIGTKGCQTQGKASNQLNALRFANGHYVQAMDCNMGVFIGEAFKVPYVLRLFMPDPDRATPDPDRSTSYPDRSIVRARYIGFREFIFTGRDGSVGACHAAAEWTFGTIYQRFLSGMATRMHYGHPDFVDAFWTRSRGGMSKCSPVVNLSEDIFAGYNVRMREEDSPHIDFLEFEKGREATFNAASNFFSKIAGGSVAVLRSRDNHLICERIGLLHGLSFYFSSVAFYVSNLLIDCSIYIYVLLFLSFTLSSISLGSLQAVGSVLGTEWILSMGIVSMFPQFLELLLEFGPARAFRDIFGGFIDSTLFFIFQNKNIASAMRTGAITGVAKYFFTGRPIANQHQSWKDTYTTYWKSHYHPAFNLAMLYSCYAVLNVGGNGRLPMVLVVMSFSCWVITPIIFSPFPRCSLLKDDASDMTNFIIGMDGWEANELHKVVERGEKGKFRNLYECGLADEIGQWSDTPSFVLALCVMSRLILLYGIALTLPAEIIDFAMLFCVFIGVQWVLVMGLVGLFVVRGLENIFLFLSVVMWIAVPWCGSWVIGDRAHNPSIGTRAPEYLIGFLVFLYLLGFVKRLFLLLCRVFHDIRLRRGADEKASMYSLRNAIRFSYLYFFEHQLNVVRALLVLLVNSLVTGLLMMLDRIFPCRPHTSWLLNRKVMNTEFREHYA